jgi:hypothetical protein
MEEVETKNKKTINFQRTDYLWILKKCCVQKVRSAKAALKCGENCAG